jgi:hypothetical protein
LRVSQTIILEVYWIHAGKPSLCTGQVPCSKIIEARFRIAFFASKFQSLAWIGLIVRSAVPGARDLLPEGKIIRAVAFNLYRQFRDHLLSIPDRIGPILTAETDGDKVYQMLTGEIRKALNDFADPPP